MKKIIVVLLFQVVLSSVYAQHYLTLSNSNYGGIYSANINPANLVNSNQQMGINIASVNITANNSSRKFSFADLNKIDSNFTWNTAANEQLDFTMPHAYVQGPSVFFSKRKWGVALSSKLRAYNQITSFSSEFLPYLTGKTPNWNNKITIKDADGFSVNTHVFSDFQLSGGYRALRISKHELSVGASVKYAIGYFNFYMQGNKLDAEVDQTKKELNIREFDFKAGSNLNVSVGSQLENFNTTTGFSDFVKANDVTGKGVGFDLGATYTYMGSDLKNFIEGKNVGTYLVKVSASMIDIGNITYRNGRNFELKGAGKFNDSTIGNIDSLSIEDIEGSLRTLGFTVNSTQVGSVSKVKMPTTLYLQADFHLLKNLYLHGTLITNVVGKLERGNYTYNQVVLAPRFESKLFEASVPFTFNSTSKDVKIGASLRVGPLYFGSNDATLFFTDSKGVNFYMGFQTAFNKKQKKKKKEKK
jgi:hypothetical protein